FLDKARDGELAEVVVLEEIEKVKPLDALLPLVSVMGSGYLAKMNKEGGKCFFCWSSETLKRPSRRERVERGTGRTAKRLGFDLIVRRERDEQRVAVAASWRWWPTGWVPGGQSVSKGP